MGARAVPIRQQPTPDCRSQGLGVGWLFDAHFHCAHSGHRLWLNTPPPQQVLES